MNILAVILVLAVIGVVLYLIETYLPMPAPMKLVIRVVAIIAVLLYLLQVFGLYQFLVIPRR